MQTELYDFVSKRYWFFLLSAVVIVPGCISLVLPGGLRPGIDFTSGSIMTFQFERPVEPSGVRQAYTEMGHHEAIVQRAEDRTYVVRTTPLAGGVRGEAGTAEIASERQRVQEELEHRFGPLNVLSFDQVSPAVAAEIVRKSVLAVAGVCVGILLYLWWAFRQVRDSWRYGACAVIALIHDTLVVLGIFSLLGRFLAVELDALFITGLLTVIGFSVHDTIVVFDRIRENTVRHPSEPLEDTVNESLVQTMVRSLATSLTVLLTLLTLWLFGGVTIRNFVLALIVGIVAGTYSSIFNASMLLVVWQTGEVGRLVRWRGAREPSLARA